MTAREDWQRSGQDWPNRDASRFVRAAGIDWHVQVMGEGPTLLLLHGTGAATHSWRDLAPLLARHLTVVAPDLPGHGFTEAPPPALLTLPGMARAVAALLRALGIVPALAAGHSAGAAVLARMCLDGQIAPRGLVGLNAAMLPLPGMAGQLFAPLARLLFGLPLVPRLFAWRAGDPAAVGRLIRDTGSALDARGVALYQRVVGLPRHVGAALGMMSRWDLDGLLRDLPRLRPAVLLINGGADRTIPPATAARLRALLPATEIVTMPGLGHLAHEERPAETAAAILDFARRLGVVAA